MWTKRLKRGLRAMYRLKNHMEDVVEKLTAEFGRDEGMCPCEKCRMDAMALALNELPPAYVVTRIGEIFAEVDSTYPQRQVDAKVAVLKAVSQVKNRPKH